MEPTLKALGQRVAATQDESLQSLVGQILLEGVAVVLATKLREHRHDEASASELESKRVELVWRHKPVC